MQPKLVFGNAKEEGANRGGWFLGHFITPEGHPRSTEDLEVKWGVHSSGDSRTEWAVNHQAAIFSIPINKRFCLKFEDREIVLSREGDYVLWCV